MTLVKFPRPWHERQGDRYVIDRPLPTHWRAATCEEVRCPDYTNGWQTIVPATGEQADYIRHRSMRYFKEEPQPGGLAAFSFPAGQRCFRSWQHKLPHEGQAPLFLERGRGAPSTPIEWERWTDDFNEHMEKTWREING